MEYYHDVFAFWNTVQCTRFELNMMKYFICKWSNSHLFTRPKSFPKNSKAKQKKRQPTLTVKSNEVHNKRFFFVYFLMKILANVLRLIFYYRKKDDTRMNINSGIVANKAICTRHKVEATKKTIVYLISTMELNKQTIYFKMSSILFACMHSGQ